MHERDIILSNRKVVFAGGGTGGHLWPLASIIRYARTKYGIKPIYFGTGSSLERRVWRQEGVRQVYIPSGKRRNYISWRNLFDWIWLVAGTVKAWFWLAVIKPAIIFGKGGYGMLPAVYAARLHGIPVICHESDIVMGRANRFALNRHALLLTAFPTEFYEISEQQKGFLRYVGMPIHPSNYQIAEVTGANEKKKIITSQLAVSGKRNIRSDILIFGGSQGSMRINEAVAKTWPKLAEIGHIIHVTGQAGYGAIRQMHEKLDEDLKKRIRILAEADDLPKYLINSSLVIARAGATSLWEIAAARVPAIIIPLPEAASDHQRLNALWFSQEFSGISMLEEKNLTHEALIGLARRQISKDIGKGNTSVLMPDVALESTCEVLYEGLTASYLARKRRFHLIGRMGVSMKGVEWILKGLGHEVTGSDLVSGGHSAQNINGKLDAVIYTSAATRRDAPGQVEVEAADKLKVPCIKRSRFIANLAGVNQLIAVSGMHGKSTVASMVAHILTYCGFDPSYLIGVPDTVPKSGYVGGAKLGEGNIFVVEACEYDRSFYDFRADTAIVTNIEKEHLDYFTGGLKEIEQAFEEFIGLARPVATVVASVADDSIKRVVAAAQKRRPDIRFITNLDEYEMPKDASKEEYQFFGHHNFSNAALAAAAVSRFGITAKEAWSALCTFKGARRRLEYIGTFNDAVIYDDYGHHPTEITTDIASLKGKFPKRRITLVFQPHQASRTETFFNEFVKSLLGADHVIVTDIYNVAGREQEEKVTSEMLAKAITESGGDAAYVALPYDNVLQYLKDNIKGDDVVLTVGATNIGEVAKGLADVS